MDLSKFGNNHSEIKSKLYSACHDEHCKVWSSHMEQGFNVDENIRQILGVEGQLTTLNNLVGKVFDDKFLTQGSFTVFAPVNGAFTKLDPAVLDKLGKNPTQLKKVLAHHVIQGLVLEAGQIKKLSEYDVVAAVSGDEISFDVVDGNIFVLSNNTPAKVVGTVYAKNGIVHLINNVLT